MSETWNEQELLAGVIHHPRLVLARGSGSYVWDVEGRRYLDFTAGLAVAALGHGRRDLAETLRAQFETLAHTSNLYGNVPALELARRLKESSFAHRIWFANSGTEANEAAIKFARLRGRAADTRKKEVVAFRGGFHGRTYGALSATHHPSYRTPFAPLVPGFRFADFGDLASVEKVMSSRTCAVIVEPVQGEGGVLPATPEFLRGLRALCDRYGAALVFDEVQVGLGRLGTLYGYQSYDVVPDMITLAKPLAGGLPLGALLIDARTAAVLKPGQHGSTFSGGPAVCAVGVQVFDAIARPEFLAAVRERAAQLATTLAALAEESPLLCGARGRGLLQALVVERRHTKRVPDVIRAARERGLLVTRAGTDAIRLLPPLNCSAAEVEEAAGILRQALATASSAPGAAKSPPAPAGAPHGTTPAAKSGTRAGNTVFESVTVSEGVLE